MKEPTQHTYMLGITVCVRACTCVRVSTCVHALIVGSKRKARDRKYVIKIISPKPQIQSLILLLHCHLAHCKYLLSLHCLVSSRSSGNLLIDRILNVMWLLNLSNISFMFNSFSVKKSTVVSRS